MIRTVLNKKLKITYKNGKVINLISNLLRKGLECLKRYRRINKRMILNEIKTTYIFNGYTEYTYCQDSNEVMICVVK